MSKVEQLVEICFLLAIRFFTFTFSPSFLLQLVFPIFFVLEFFLPLNCCILGNLAPSCQQLLDSYCEPCYLLRQWREVQKSVDAKTILLLNFIDGVLY